MRAVSDMRLAIAALVHGNRYPRRGWSVELKGDGIGRAHECRLSGASIGAEWLKRNHFVPFCSVDSETQTS